MRVLTEEEVIAVARKTTRTIAEMLPEKDKGSDWAEMTGGMFAYAVFEALYKAKAETTP